MPNARLVTIALATLLVAPALRAQQPDSTARRDSIRADSIRRAELARIRGEPRPRPADEAAERGHQVRPNASNGGSLVLSIAGEGVGDFSPRAAARAPGSRLRAGDVRVALAANPTRRLHADLSLTFQPDSLPKISTAAVMADLFDARLTLRAGKQAVPFGIAAPRQHVELWFPEQPLPVRAFLGERGVRSTGLLAAASRSLAGIPIGLRVGVFDRFGNEIDSIRTPEPADQSLSGLAGFGRLVAEWGWRGAHLTLGASAITGKREQPIGCVYRSTVGPVACPNGINGANTRMSVLGGDGQLVLGMAVIEAEWMRNVVGATDLPVFDRPGFAPYYSGMYGTYDGAYAQLRLNGPGIARFGMRVEGAQNPAVSGLNDRTAGAYLGVEPMPGGRVILSYQRRLPSAAAKEYLDPDQREALDRIVLRGTVSLAWLLARGDE